MNPNRHTTSTVLIWILGTALVVSLATNFYIMRDRNAKRYPYLAKRLFINNPRNIIIDFVSLRTKLREYVAKQPEKIGLYFEYLPTGTSISINSETEFFRASLVKLPMIMRLYKYVENGDINLKTELSVKEEHLDSGFGSLYKQGPGTKLTISKLVELVLAESDNTAFNVLYELVNVKLGQDTPQGDKAIDDVYRYLDIPYTDEATTPMITAKNYSSILKSLYFSAYLPFEYSNEMLKIMADSGGTHPLKKGVPQGVKVADKIGIYQGDNTSLEVMSDCGIVFFDSRPYLLCIMIHSADSQHSSEKITEISEIVFRYLRDFE